MNQTIKKDSSREGVPNKSLNFKISYMRVILVAAMAFLACSCSKKRERLAQYCLPIRILVIDTTSKKLDLDNLFYLFNKYDADTIFSGNRTYTMNSQDFQFEIVEH